MKRKTVFGSIGAIAAAGLVAGISVIWPGLDAQDAPPAETSVWALQTGDGHRYARVNTSVGELDTVRQVTNPGSIAQADGGAWVFADGKIAQINQALPTNLDEETLRDAGMMPPGTQDTITAGSWVAYRTDAGEVLAGKLVDGIVSQVTPYDDDEATPSGSESSTEDADEPADDAEQDADAEEDDGPDYSAEAVALNEDGLVFAYSRTDGAVLTFDATDGTVVSVDNVDDAGETPLLTAVGEDWFLFDPEAGTIFRAGDAPTFQVETIGEPVFSRSMTEGDAAYIADQGGLISLPVDEGDAERVVGGADRDLGVPARPMNRNGTVYAAWMGSTSGTLWKSGSGEEALDYNGATLDEQRRPTFLTSANAMILNETRKGWVWTMPNGELVESSQDWGLGQTSDPNTVPSEEEATVVVEPKAPVAVNDSFGVRPASLSVLPVVLNDHDANEDVLSIDPASIVQPDPAFGTVALTDNGGRLVVKTTPEASGSATFQYRLTDGTSSEGLYSNEATVTLTIADEGQNAAPEFCGSEGCLATWPEPEVAPGGTVTVPVLNGWVDPEGDPLLVLDVTNPTGVGAAAVTPKGEVVYQHHDSSTAETTDVNLEVTVADTRGAQQVKVLTVRVAAAPVLVAESFTVVDSFGIDLTVDVSRHVTGTVGELSLTDVRMMDSDKASVSTSVNGTSFDFTAQEPGIYRVSYTISDGKTTASGTARITMLAADAPAQLASAPVVAFVRPQEDTTVDVFAAVSNPTRRVLLLNDVVAEEANGARLQVDTVAQNFLRVSGSTLSGDPGMLGKVTYTVGDGTEDVGANIQGEATVYLLPPARDVAPIAVDDSIVVRAGSQIDIPALDNDVAAAGAGLSLDPSKVTSTTDAALAFASGSQIRYLAPSEPGTYGIDYTIYSTGSPSLADTATIKVTVLSDELNRGPRPKLLEGRVLAGASVVIPFENFGVDPDGDPVTLEKILTQPAQGAASITADGTGIEYTSAFGKPGQYSFTYSVVDALGESRSGVARVGVLNDRANPSPVTYTDYTQVQAGENSTVLVSPLENDLDPTGGAMKVTSVVPNLAETLEDGSPNPEYARWASQITKQTETELSIAAGADPGTMSFIYSVESASGNTGRGLIVVQVVREKVPAYPVVADTILTAETRENFPDGIDVLSGRVTWAGGAAADLDVSLWGTPKDVVQTGRLLSGKLPEKSRIIPFAVTGKTSDGTDVTTYAFLRVPGAKDSPLTLRASVQPQIVEEKASVAFDMAAMVGIPSDAKLEVSPEVAASGARAAATCTLTSGTTVTYAAGEGAPFADSCTVPVRLAGGDDWTYLSVPIRVTPLAPVPELRAGALTVSPGESATFDLTSMTVWQGENDNANTTWQIDGTSSDFEIGHNGGSTVTVTATDTAVPGRESAVLVLITSHESVAPARLVLRVGPAPETAPRGGTTAIQCSQAAGTVCDVSVVGAPGEVNPFPNTPLVLTGVGETASCAGVSFSVVDSVTVRASWTADAPGASCRTSFTLQDAQGRQTTGERNGSLTFDLQGYPLAPASISQTAYDDGTVTLRIDPGSARSAYPAIGGFTVTWNGTVVATCTADGVCPAISAPNGEQRTYEAVSFNSVGNSRTSVSTTGWAYNPPERPASFKAAPVATQGQGHMVRLDFTGVDPETGHIEISSPKGDSISVAVTGGGVVSVPSYRVGSNEPQQITATPFSRFPIPAGLEGTTSGSEISTTGNGVGAPVNPTISVDSVATANDKATITATVGASANGNPTTLWYGVSLNNQPCTVSQTSTSFSIPDQQGGESFTVNMCTESRIGTTSFGKNATTATLTTKQSTAAPTGYTFNVAYDGEVRGDQLSATWTIKDTPTSASKAPYKNDVKFSGYPGVTNVGSDPNISVYYQHQVTGAKTESAKVTPAAGSAPYQTQAQWAVNTCNGGSTLGFTSSSTDSKATISVTKTTYYDKRDKRLNTPSGGVVPDNAVKVTVEVTASWGSSGWNLGDAWASFSATCKPKPEPSQPPTTPPTSPTPDPPTNPPTTPTPDPPTDPSPEPPAEPDSTQSRLSNVEAVVPVAPAEPVAPEQPVQPDPPLVEQDFAPVDEAAPVQLEAPEAPPAEPTPDTSAPPQDAQEQTPQAALDQPPSSAPTTAPTPPDDVPPEPPPEPLSSG